MRRYVTHNWFHADYRWFTKAILRFFDESPPRKRERIVESVTDSFRTVIHDGFRMVG